MFLLLALYPIVIVVNKSINIFVCITTNLHINYFMLLMSEFVTLQVIQLFPPKLLNILNSKYIGVKHASYAAYTFTILHTSPSPPPQTWPQPSEKLNEATQNSKSNEAKDQIHAPNGKLRFWKVTGELFHSLLL